MEDSSPGFGRDGRSASSVQAETQYAVDSSESCSEASLAAVQPSLVASSPNRCSADPYLEQRVITKPGLPDVDHGLDASGNCKLQDDAENPLAPTGEPRGLDDAVALSTHRVVLHEVQGSHSVSMPGVNGTKRTASELFLGESGSAGLASGPGDSGKRGC